MVSLLATIFELLDKRKNKVLTAAAIGLPPSQYEAFRKIVLDELGKSGFQKDVEEVLKQHKDR